MKPAVVYNSLTITLCFAQMYGFQAVLCVCLGFVWFPVLHIEYILNNVALATGTQFDLLAYICVSVCVLDCVCFIQTNVFCSDVVKQTMRVSLSIRCT